MKEAAKTITRAAQFDRVRQDFPLLGREVNGNPLVYLDNAASSQMPAAVADRLDRYHRSEHSNVHRGIHTLSQHATAEYESTRKKVAEFIGADSEEEIVFTTGTTDSINLVANSFGLQNLSQGDEIILSGMEHHANIVPWQMIVEKTGAVIKVIPVLDSGDLDMEAFAELLTEKTKIVAVVHVSNALGTVNPVKEITRLAQQSGAAVCIDGAQAVPHQPVNVIDIGCDFYAFSAHKMCGPTGFGVLYGKKERLEDMPPYRGGGDMIDKVTFEKTTYNVVPFRFEAGTPPIAAGIGLGTAIDYLREIGMEEIARREEEIVNYALNRIREVEGIRVIGRPEQRASVISFVHDQVHPHDLGTIIDKQGIAIRTGHHCAQPVMERFGVTATARASFSFYNNENDVDRFINSLDYLKEFFELD